MARKTTAYFLVAVLCLCITLLAIESIARLSAQIEEEGSHGKSGHQNKDFQLRDQLHSALITKSGETAKFFTSRALSTPAYPTTVTLPAGDLENTICSAVWFQPKVSHDGNITCECGSDVGGIVHCYNIDSKVRLLLCYCMTYSADGSMLVVGRCVYGCFQAHFFVYDLESNSSKLNKLCSKYHREGQLCGKCEDGFALPAYSYSLVCVKCENSNWGKYIAASLLPLTLFFITMVTLRVSVTSGTMNVFILMSQLLSVPAVSRYFVLQTNKLNPHSHSSILLNVFFSIYSIWNLDFFRLLYPPFCLQPATTTVQILALEYITAVYPLVLLVLAYILVNLHDSNTRIIVWLWRPFHRCFAHCRSGWSIKTSLIDAFATFLLLSYMKFLSVSVDLLIPVHIFNMQGQPMRRLYLYWDGTIEYFGSAHLPYAILALTVIMIFNILPLLLLCLYPSRRFHRLILNRCRYHRSQALYIFMDSFQGCFKDGTNGNRDCRWFAGLFLFVRIISLVIIAATTSEFAYPAIGLIILFCLLFLALFKPYRSLVHNRANIILLFLWGFMITSAMASVIAYSKAPHFKSSVSVIGGFSVLFPPAYLLGLIVYKLFIQHISVPRSCQKLCRKADNEEYETTLPDRLRSSSVLP